MFSFSSRQTFLAFVTTKLFNKLKKRKANENEREKNKIKNILEEIHRKYKSNFIDKAKQCMGRGRKCKKSCR